MKKTNNINITPFLTNFFKTGLSLGLFLSISFLANAQHESQYTHFAFNRMAYNPAYAGSKEDLTVGALYRHQWAGIEGAPRTINATVHTPFFNKKCGAGLMIYGDKIGITNTMSVAFDYNYKIKMGNGTLSMGVRAEGEYGSMDLSSADPSDAVDNLITTTAANPTRVSPNFGGGMYFSNQKFYVGASVPRIFKNHLYSNFPDGRDVRTAYLTGGVILPVGTKVKLMPSAMASVNFSAPWQYDFNLNAIFMNTLWIGGSYRVNDSFDALIQYQLNGQTRFGMSYDFTTSALKKSSNGSLEVMIEHTFCNCAKENITNLRFF
jgi:type IX secretion system PorP/SprF family membrane protein